MLENNRTGFESTEIENVVGNQYFRLIKHQHNSKVLSASKRTTKTDRGVKNRRPPNYFQGNCYICEKKGHRAEKCRSTKKKFEKSRDAADRKKGGGRGKCYVCGSEEHFSHKRCGLFRRFEHRTRD